MEKQNIPFDRAEELVKENDRVRRAFVEEFYKVPWGTVNAFDLVINTGKISPDMAVAWIINAAQDLKSQSYAGMPTTSSIKVDRIMVDAVSEALERQKIHI
jgi:cytidylate kinase